MLNVGVVSSPLRPPPRTVTCYICGRSYGINSISIHVSACEKLYQEKQANLPPRERKALPEKIDYSSLMSRGLGGSESQDAGALVDKLNEEARETSNSLMESCSNCGRTFNPDRLVVHNRSCTADRPHKKLVSGGGSGGGNVSLDQPRVSRHSAAVSSGNVRPRSQVEQTYEPNDGKKSKGARLGDLLEKLHRMQTEFNKELETVKSEIKRLIAEES